MAHWRFVPKLGDKSFCRSWLSVTPHYGILLPNESVDITITLLVDAPTAHALNTGCELLNDILVLRVENGTDSFITVHADYARSCYGMSLSELMCTLKPIRYTLSPTDRKTGETEKNTVNSNVSSSSLSLSLSPELGVPKEVWRLVDHLFRGGMEEPDLFIVGGETGEMFMIRESLDTGRDFPSDVSPLSVGSALLEFLLALPEPLIAPEHYPAVELDEQNVRPWSRRFLENLPVPSYNLFVYLMSFFRELLVHKINRLTPAKLAATSVSHMTRCSGISREEKIRVDAMHTVVSYFLTTTAI